MGGGQEHREDYGARGRLQGEWARGGRDRRSQEGNKDVVKGSGGAGNLVAYGVKTCGGTKASTAAESGGIASQGVAPVAYVKKKSYQDWRLDREKVKIMGPDAAISSTS